MENFRRLKKAFLVDVTTVVTMEEIPPELVFNWDQTGIRLVPCSSWTMERQGEKRVEMVGVNDKRQYSAATCLDISYLYSWSTRVKHLAVILAILSGWLACHAFTESFVNRRNNAPVHRALHYALR